MKVNPDTLIKLSYKRVFFLSLVFDLLIFYYNTLYLSCIFRFTKRYDSIRCFLYNPQTKVRQKSFIFRIIIINHHIPCCSTSQINFETICTYHRNNICRIIQMKQSSNIVIFFVFLQVCNCYYMDQSHRIHKTDDISQILFHFSEMRILLLFSYC